MNDEGLVERIELFDNDSRIDGTGGRILFVCD
jgi:hypothetical protein